MIPIHDDDTGEAPRFLSRSDLDPGDQTGLDSLGTEFPHAARSGSGLVPFDSRPPADDKWVFDDTEGIPVGLPNLLTPTPLPERDATDEWTGEEAAPPTLGVPMDALRAVETALAQARQRTIAVGVGALVVGAALGAGAVLLLA